MSRRPFFWDVFGIRCSLYFSRAQKLCPTVGPQMPLLMEHDNLETKSLAIRCDLRYLFLGKSGCKSRFWDLRADTELFALPTPAFWGVCSDQHAKPPRT